MSACSCSGGDSTIKVDIKNWHGAALYLVPAHAPSLDMTPPRVSRVQRSPAGHGRPRTTCAASATCRSTAALLVPSVPATTRPSYGAGCARRCSRSRLDCTRDPPCHLPCLPPARSARTTSTSCASTRGCKTRTHAPSAVASGSSRVRRSQRLPHQAPVRPKRPHRRAQIIHSEFLFHKNAMGPTATLNRVTYEASSSRIVATRPSQPLAG